MRIYDFYENVEDSTNLGRLFNRTLKSTLIMRIVSAPKVFEPDSEMRMHQIVGFYDSCLIELYLHSVIQRLNEWKNKSIDYCNEFDCSWQYYAASRRLESINKYGGDEDDYDEDNNIIMIGKERLKSYSIVSEMRCKDTRDIFMDTTNKDLGVLYSAVIADGKFNVQDIFKKATGKTIATYRQDENGDIVENKFGEDVMRTTNKKIASEDMVSVLKAVFLCVHKLIEEVKGLKENADNKKFFTSLPGRIDRIFELEI